MELKATVSEIDEKVLRHVHRDPQEWFQRFVDGETKRARRVLLQKSVSHALGDSAVTSMPGTEDEILNLEFDRTDYKNAEALYVERNPVDNV